MRRGKNHQPKSKRFNFVNERLYSECVICVRFFDERVFDICQFIHFLQNLTGIPNNVTTRNVSIYFSSDFIAEKASGIANFAMIFPKYFLAWKNKARKLAYVKLYANLSMHLRKKYW